MGQKNLEVWKRHNYSREKERKIFETGTRSAFIGLHVAVFFTLFIERTQAVRQTRPYLMRPGNAYNPTTTRFQR